MATKLSEKDCSAIWDLHGQGLNINLIAQRLGRAYSSVATVIKASGGVRPGPTRRSPLRLSLAEREEITRGVAAGLAFSVIATGINRATSTVSREVARNGGRRKYRACRADRSALVRACRPKVSKLAANPTLRAEVAARLATRWSPQQIAAALRLDYPDDPSMWVSHEAIYQALFVPSRAVFAPGTHRSLRSGRARRRSHQDHRRERRGKNPHMVLIAKRPVEVEDRRTGGHWEGDLIMGRGHRRAIGTIVERSSRFLILLDLVEGFSADALNAALTARLASLPAGLRRTLTWDQGTEMSGHLELTATTGIPVYFCDPRSPWQRGTNENTNGLLRQYFPKSVDLAGLTQLHLDHVAAELNARPRKTLKWATPAAHFAWGSPGFVVTQLLCQSMISGIAHHTLWGSHCQGRNAPFPGCRTPRYTRKERTPVLFL
jgi:IS30 family transposase